MSDDRLDALIRKVYCYKPDDELYTELNTNDVSQYDTARQFAEFHLEQLDQLRAVLAEYSEAVKYSTHDLSSAEFKPMIYIDVLKALSALADALGGEHE